MFKAQKGRFFRYKLIIIHNILSWFFSEEEIFQEITNFIFYEK